VTDSHPAETVWRKSLASTPSGDCVEVAFTDESVLVRNSQDPHGPRLSFSYSEWTAFVTGINRGEFSPDRAS
jgi:hypothetical protein